jgi:RNA polymerase sigma-70 factor (ECF subfamily)
MGEGEAALMRALHEEYAASLWRYALRLTGGDAARSQDIVQETLLRAWRHPSVLDQSSGSARGWLFTVARHLVIDDWRTRRSQLEVLTSDLPEPETSDGTEELLQSWVVADALGRLSDEHRAVIVECYYRGRSVAQAARVLDIPEGTVKSRTHYALRALRLELDEMGVSQ